MQNYKTMFTPDLVEVVRTMEIDHKPDGWPAVQTALLTELANRLTRSVTQFEEISDEMVDFMARAAEAENAADVLAVALKDAVSTYQGETKLVTAERQEAWDAALVEAVQAQEWRNGGALNKHKARMAWLGRQDGVALIPFTAGAPHRFGDGTRGWNVVKLAVGDEGFSTQDGEWFADGRTPEEAIAHAMAGRSGDL